MRKITLPTDFYAKNQRVMKSLARIILALMLFVGCAPSQPSGTLFLWGSDINLKFTRYVADLTGKENPHILYLPTASGDHQDNIQVWEALCKIVGIEPHIMRVWIDSSAEQTFEEQIAEADAIVVGGGNTLNMLGIWLAQDIDRMLMEALQRGAIIAGGSAGSIAWFDAGISDSRPAGLSIVDGLGILPHSNCPHYGDEAKRSLYHQMLEQGEIEGGYAMDDKAGILFRDGEVVEAVTYSPEHQAYYVDVVQGKATATPIETRLLLEDGAIDANAYTAEPIGKSVKDLAEADGAVEVFVTQAGADATTRIETLLTYGNLAAIVHDQYMDLFGSYAIRFLYNHNGTWLLQGEDLGATIAESEVVFREKATTMLRQAEEKYKE